jgi:hypothetical protein
VDFSSRVLPEEGTMTTLGFSEAIWVLVSESPGIGDLAVENLTL